MTALTLPSTWLPVVDAIVKATLVLMLAAGATILLRRASAALRHLVWVLSLASALLLPIVTFAMPKWQLPLFTVADRASAATIETTVGADDGPMPVTKAPALGRDASVATPPAAPDVAASAPAPAPSWRSTITWQRALIGVWLAGAVVILGRIVVGLIALRLLSRRTPAITDAEWLPMARAMASELGVSPRLRFLRSGKAAMPIAAGVFRPVVIIPKDADTWARARLRIVLLHELAHVKRRDCLTHLLAQAACAFYWFNPLAWFAVKRARTERERACDDLVLAYGTRGSDYAAQLIEMARVLRGDRFPALLAGASLAVAHRSQLEGRLMAILDPKVPRAGLSRGRAFVAMAMCVVAVASLGALQPWTDGSDDAVDPVSTSVKPPDTTVGPRAAGLHTTTGVETNATTVRHQKPQLPQLPQLPQSGQLSQPGQPVQPMQPMQPEQSQRPMPMPTPHPMPMPMPTPHPMPVPSEAWQIGHDAGRAAAESIDSRAIAEAVAEAMEQVDVAEAARGQRKPADPRLIAALTAALKDSDKEVRETAMQALVQMRDPSIFDPLVQGLKDTSPDVREQAAHGLGQLRDKRAVQPLLAALKEDTNAGVREQAVHALGQLRDPAAVDALALAVRDSNPSVREQAVHALGQFRDKRAVEPLVVALKDTSAGVREQAVHALGQLRDPAAFDGLVLAARDTNSGVREQAVHALGQFRDKRAVEPLISALKDTSPSVRQEAAHALGQLRDPRAIDALIVATKDTNADVREQVVFALGQLRDPRAIDALTEALKDPNAGVRQQAAHALGQLVR